MAKPAAAPMAPTAMFWLHDMRAAAPVKAAVGAGEVKVPLDTGGTTPVETVPVGIGTTVGTWIWPSVIWVTGATEVGAWIWPSVIWVTGATGAEVGAWIWPSVICVTGAGTEVGA